MGERFGFLISFIICLIISFYLPSGEILANHILINEVYYDVDSTHGAESDNEWLELYNSTDSDLTLTSWSIVDNISSKTIPTTLIKAKSSLIITAQSSTWPFWSITADKIFLGASIGNGLGNTGDRLMLKDSSGAIHDSLSYGSDSIFPPALSGVAEGHSLERMPAGNSFIDQFSPSPGILALMLPTSTPPPVPTLTPTTPPIPTPTKTPTPQPTSTSPTSPPSPTPKSSPTPTIKSSSTSKTSPIPTEVISEQILGLMNVSPTLTPTPTQPPAGGPIKVASFTFNNIFMTAFGIILVLISALAGTFLIKSRK